MRSTVNVWKQEDRRYMSRESLDALAKTEVPEGPALEHGPVMLLDAAA